MNTAMLIKFSPIIFGGLRKLFCVVKNRRKKKMSIEQDAQRYAEAGHAMQSGVMATLSLDYPGLSDGDHQRMKDLRVGINSAHVSDLAIGKLLIAKGIVTAEEYHKAMADAMEEEAARFEKELSERTGKSIKLA